MTKDLRLKLVRISQVETDAGTKHSWKFQYQDSDDEYDVNLTLNFWGSIPEVFREALENIQIYDKISIEVGADTRQAKLQ